MNLQQLQDYNFWVGKTPWEIREAVKGVGGWKVVFPHELPLWAHRVRNYFNREPAVLKRLNESRAKPHLDRLEAGYPKGSSWMDDFKIKNAIQGYPFKEVYKDLYGCIWFQMAKASTIYHWGDDPKRESLEGVGQEVKPWDPPVFKLISPDGTGGSGETIIKNPNRVLGPYSVLSETEVDIKVEDRVITDSWHQGSYNYSETTVSGTSEHQKRDVETHKLYKMNNVYINPPDRFASLRVRRFPIFAPNEGTPLAVQKNVRDIPNIITAPPKYNLKKMNQG